MKIASFDVDAQKGFTPLCPNELPVPGGDAIAHALNQLAERAAIVAAEHAQALTAQLATTLLAETLAVTLP